MPVTERSHVSNSRDVPESIEKRGAERLAAIIYSYWQGLGYLGIRTWAEKTLVLASTSAQPTNIYVVRSNISASGFPPKTVSAALAA